MLEKYIEYLENNLTKKILGDGTKVFYLGDKKVIDIYAPLSIEEIAGLEMEVSRYSEAYKRGKTYFPIEYARFLYEANGLDCFYSAFALGGMQTLDRTNFELNSPFGLWEYNKKRPISIPSELTGIGAYGFNHSNICVDKSGKIYVCDGEIEKMLLEPGDYKKYLQAEVKIIAEYDTLIDFLMQETDRLLKMFVETPWDPFTKGKKTLPGGTN